MTTPQGLEATTQLRLQIEDIHVRSHKRVDGTYDTDTFATQYGTELCITRFREPVHVNPFHKIKKTDNPPAKIPVKRDDNIRRAKRNMKRLMIHNFPHDPAPYSNPHFITLTYPDTAYAKIKNRDNHIADFQQFIRLLRHQVKTNRDVFTRGSPEDITYIATLELTKKGNVHIHAVIFNLPFYRHKHDVLNLWLQVSPSSTINNQQLDRVPWGRKSAKVQAVKMARYLSKYIAKAFEDNNLPNDKLYLPSKGLKQPTLYKKPSDVSLVFEGAFIKMYRKTFVSEEYYIPYLDTWAHYEIWELT